MGPAIAIIGVLILLSPLLGFLIIKNLIYLCGPNEVLVFAGRDKFEPAQRRKVGYRLVKGGRGLRIPLLEQVSRMDLSNMAVNVQVSNAFSKGGIPLNIQGVANLKIAGDQPYVGYAVERFLGKERGEVIRVAKETLEGNLRGVLARLTPEQVNEDKNAFAEMLVEEADADLKAMGLHLDTLKIQNVTDDVGYLDAIGRVRSAELVKRATVAEAKARAESTIKDAANTEKTAIARIDAEIGVAKAEAQRRIVDAQTRKTAMVAEQRGQVAAEVARAEADVAVQTARKEQIRLKLEADLIRPAAARKAEMENRAKADAARIVADGQATVKALQDYVNAWKQGGNAREVVMMQKMRALSEAFASTVGDIHLDNVAVVDTGQGGLGSDIPKLIVDVVSRLKAALPEGVDGLLPGNGAAAQSRAQRPAAAKRPTAPAASSARPTGRPGGKNKS